MTAILYVDDEPAIRRAVQLWLARYGIIVHTATGVHDAKVAVAEHRLDGVFVDLWLEDGSGMELYDWLRAEHPALARHVAFVSGDAAAATTQRRVAATGCPVLAKPFDLDLLKTTAEHWVRGTGGAGGMRLDVEHRL